MTGDAHLHGHDLLSSAQSNLVNQNTGAAACGNELMRMVNEHSGRYPYGPLHIRGRRRWCVRGL